MTEVLGPGLLGLGDGPQDLAPMLGGAEEPFVDEFGAVRLGARRIRLGQAAPLVFGVDVAAQGAGAPSGPSHPGGPMPPRRPYPTAPF